MAEDTTKDAPEVGSADTGEEKQRYESSVETVGPCKVELTITVPVETIREEFDDRYAEIIKTVAFPGFRIGHAPRKLVEKRLGDDVTNDVREHVISEAFKDAFERHDLSPITDPDVDLDEIGISPDSPVTFKATMTVRPVVEVPDLEAIRVEKVEPGVSGERIEEIIAGLRRQHAVLEPVDGPLESEDVAYLDILARVEDEKIVERENVEYQHPSPFLAGLRLPDLPNAVLGKKPGDELTVTETLPDTWPNAEQAGKDLTVEIEVMEVKRSVLPELDQAFAEALDYDSVGELREEVEEQVEREAENEARQATDRAMVDALIAAAPFELPEDVVREETGRRIARLTATLRMRGAGEEEIEEKLAEARSAERAEVERDFRSGFLLDTIAKQEKVFVTETEVKARIADMAAAYHRTPEEMEEYLEQRDMLGSVRSSMREEKVIELLRKKVKIEEKA